MNNSNHTPGPGWKGLSLAALRVSLARRGGVAARAANRWAAVVASHARRWLASELPQAAEDDVELPFLAHLIELRMRLLRCLLALVVVLVVLMPWSGSIYTWASQPLLRYLPEGSSMIAIKVASPFFIPFKLTAVVALLVSLPYLLYQVWAFVAPGLYRHERRMVWPLLLSSTALFFGGMAFCYYVVFPLVFSFFTSTAPQGVKVMTDISEYLDFMLMSLVSFGAAFQVPIATIVLVSTGAVDRQQLSRSRPYVIVGVFLVAAVLTPPEVISQVLMALPLWLLYEIGLLLSRAFEGHGVSTETTNDR